MSAGVHALNDAAHAFLDLRLDGESKLANAVLSAACVTHGTDKALTGIVRTLISHINTSCPDEHRTAGGTPRIARLIPPLELMALAQYGTEHARLVASAKETYTLLLQRLVRMVHQEEESQFHEALNAFLYPRHENGSIRPEHFMMTLVMACAVADGRRSYPAGP